MPYDVTVAYDGREKKTGGEVYKYYSSDLLYALIMTEMEIHAECWMSAKKIPSSHMSCTVHDDGFVGFQTGKNQITNVLHKCD